MPQADNYALLMQWYARCRIVTHALQHNIDLPNRHLQKLTGLTKNRIEVGNCPSEHQDYTPVACPTNVELSTPGNISEDVIARQSRQVSIIHLTSCANIIL
jgi:hypothetical protein